MVHPKTLKPLPCIYTGQNCALVDRYSSKVVAEGGITLPLNSIEHVKVSVDAYLKEANLHFQPE